MIANQQAHRYREVAIKTANPLQLVVILYDGAIHALQEAQEHIRHKNIAGRARCLNRSVAIISELQACLNFKEGGKIADSLNRLYSYMERQIFKANIDQSAEPLAEVVILLENLRSAWGELVAKSQGANSVESATKPASVGVVNAGTTGLSSLNVSG
jgi:flagellar secretion chaperone FliS